MVDCCETEKQLRSLSGTLPLVESGYNIAIACAASALSAKTLMGEGTDTCITIAKILRSPQLHHAKVIEDGLLQCKRPRSWCMDKVFADDLKTIYWLLLRVLNYVMVHPKNNSEIS